MTKTLTFAILHFSVAFTVTYLLTGSVIIGGTVALVEPAVNTVVFYFHEKVWSRYNTNKYKKVIYSERFLANEFKTNG